MTVNEVAMLVHTMMFWYTPYRTGNLARSVGDVFGIGNKAGFQIFNATQRASYGEILNEVPVINYRVQNPYTGVEYTGSYANTHYRWIDNGMEAIANQIPLYLPVRRIS